MLNVFGKIPAHEQRRPPPKQDPGTGAFIGAIQHRLAGRGWHIAVEVNPRFAGQLAALHPAVDVVNAGAGDLDAVLARRGLSQIDVVFSGPPLRLKSVRSVPAMGVQPCSFS